MKYLPLIVIALASCAPDAHAQIRAEWHHIYGTDAMGRVTILETDGHRVFAATSDGVYVSDGYTWRLTEFKLPVKVMATSPQSIYVGSNVYDGLFQSDDRGKTWEPLNNGLGYIDETHRLDDGPFGYGVFKYFVHTPYGTIISVMTCCTDDSADVSDTWRDAQSNWRVDDTDWILGYGVKLLYGMDHIWCPAGLAVYYAPVKDNPAPASSLPSVGASIRSLGRPPGPCSIIECI